MGGVETESERERVTIIGLEDLRIEVVASLDRLRDELASLNSSTTILAVNMASLQRSLQALISGEGRIEGIGGDIGSSENKHVWKP